MNRSQDKRRDKNMVKLKLWLERKNKDAKGTEREKDSV